MRSVVIALLLGSLFAAPLGQARPGPLVLAACAAFALDGSSAAVTADASSLSLEVTDPLGKVTHLNLGLRYSTPPWHLENQPYEPYSRFLSMCQVAFNRSGDLIAVSVATSARLQIGVADLRNSKWVGDFDVEKQPEFSPVALAGFLERGNSVVVTGALPAKGSVGIQAGSFATLLFDTTGRQLVSAPAVRTGLGPSDGLDGPILADAAHDRIWSLPCVVYDTKISKEPTCPILSTTLLREESQRSVFDPRGYVTKRTDLWMDPNTFASLDPNTLLIAESVAVEGNTIWRVDIQKRTLQRFVLPKRRHFPNFENIDGPAVPSPDGQVLAFLLEQGAVAFPFLVDNYVYKGADIAVVQVQPFRLLGIVPHQHGVYHPWFAVDHRQGKVTILVYWRNRWERREFSCPPDS